MVTARNPDYYYIYYRMYKHRYKEYYERRKAKLKEVKTDYYYIFFFCDQY